MCSSSRDTLRLGQRSAYHYLYVDGYRTNITRWGSGSHRRPAGRGEEQTTLPRPTSYHGDTENDGGSTFRSSRIAVTDECQLTASCAGRDDAAQ